jgi:hypothetical protein
MKKIMSEKKISETDSVLTDAVILRCLEELWPSMEAEYSQSHPLVFTQETFTDSLNDFARHFSPDFINTLFMSCLGIIGRKISGELDEEERYYDLKQEDFPRGKEFVTKHGPKDMHYSCMAPWVFKTLSLYRALHDILRKRYEEGTGHKAASTEQKNIGKKVYRGLLFSLEKCYNDWNEQGIADFLNGK